MKCPACAAEMLEHDVPAPPDDNILIDRCTAGAEGCGVWYDTGEYHALHARLADSSVREALVHAARAPVSAGARPWPCPRCAQRGRERALTRVHFVGEDLGLCEGCLGVWAPREAIAGVLAGMALHDPGGEALRATHYRAVAAGPQMQQNRVLRAKCAGCEQLVAAGDTTLSEFGLLCVPCGAMYAREGKLGAEAQREAGSALWSYLRRVFGLFGRGKGAARA